MASQKVSKPAVRAVAPRHRSHSLAPEHLGERAAAATVLAAIGGVSIFIAAVGMTIGGLTIPSRYAGGLAPPNIGELGLGQIVGGIGLLVLSLLIIGSAAALLADLRGSRAALTAISAVTALLAAAGFALLMSASQRDAVLLAAVGVAFLAFASAAFILARPQR